MGKANPVKLLNGTSWPTKTKAKAHFSLILGSYKNGERISTPQHHSDLAALVTAYDAVLESGAPTKAGPGVAHFEKRPDPVKRPVATSCFFVVRKDGSSIDFSFHDAIDAAASNP